MRSNFYQKINKLFWLAVLVIFLFFCLSLTTLWTINNDKTILGLAIAGIKAGGQNSEQIAQLVANQTEKFNRQKITFAYGEKTWSFSPEDLGININQKELAAEALAFGHEPITVALVQQTKSLFMGQNLPLIYSLESSKFKKNLSILATIEIPAANASFKYNPQKNDFAVMPAQNGAIINRAKLIKDILKTFNRPPQIVYLSLDKKNPQITAKELEQIIKEAAQLIDNAPYFLQSANATWRIEKTELAGWILPEMSNSAPQKMQLSLNAKALTDFLTPLAVSINREPINAKLTLENNELKFAVLSQNGQKLNIPASAKKIGEDILTGKKNIYLIIDSIEPQISNQNTKELGLLTLLGKGESNFSGSPINRRHNIKTGAAKLNGFLIKPGEEFSFSQNIGAIDEQNGWVQELVIKNKQTIPEYGGGLCQISTTLFRAAVKSGLKIIERYPHAYPVHYYDPPGFDATVYPPSPDLKFLNDTPGHLLLQNKIEGNKLIFEIYGSNDGRQIKIKGPTITQKNPDGSLKTILTQEIWRNGQIEQQNIFRSSYNSPNLYPIVTPTPTPSLSPAN